MRTFVAIALEPEIRDSLARLQTELKKTGADVKWVDPANIHLTLKFLGEIDEQRCKAVTAAMQDICSRIKIFTLGIAGVGAFPSLRSPRVIWAGLNRGSGETKILAESLENKIAQLGIPKEEREFTTHITIGRTRSDRGRIQLVEALETHRDIVKGQALEMAVEKITLFKSTLTPRGPIYEPILAINLATT